MEPSFSTSWLLSTTCCSSGDTNKPCCVSDLPTTSSPRDGLVVSPSLIGLDTCSFRSLPVEDRVFSSIREHVFIYTQTHNLQSPQTHTQTHTQICQRYHKHACIMLYIGPLNAPYGDHLFHRVSRSTSGNWLFRQARFISLSLYLSHSLSFYLSRSLSLCLSLCSVCLPLSVFPSLHQYSWPMTALEVKKWMVLLFLESGKEGRLRAREGGREGERERGT